MPFGIGEAAGMFVETRRRLEDAGLLATSSFAGGTSANFDFVRRRNFDFVRRRNFDFVRRRNFDC